MLCIIGITFGRCTFLMRRIFPGLRVLAGVLSTCILSDSAEVRSKGDTFQLQSEVCRDFILTILLFGVFFYKTFVTHIQELAAALIRSREERGSRNWCNIRFLRGSSAFTVSKVAAPSCTYPPQNPCVGQDRAPEVTESGGGLCLNGGYLSFVC